jgi:hypothetical protein
VETLAVFQIGIIVAAVVELQCDSEFGSLKLAILGEIKFIHSCSSPSHTSVKKHTFNEANEPVYNYAFCM